jgi:hypothetical protein
MRAAIKFVTKSLTTRVSPPQPAVATRTTPQPLRHEQLRQVAGGTVPSPAPHGTW